MALRSAGVRGFFRDAVGRLRTKTGKFASKAKYREALNARRGPTGKFLSGKQAARNARAEESFRAEWGAPPSGWDWVQIASKYPDRFEEYWPTS